MKPIKEELRRKIGKAVEIVGVGVLSCRIEWRRLWGRSCWVRLILFREATVTLFL
jgi:hypothetical protein